MSFFAGIISHCCVLSAVDVLGDTERQVCVHLCQHASNHRNTPVIHLSFSTKCTTLLNHKNTHTMDNDHFQKRLGQQVTFFWQLF